MQNERRESIETTALEVACCFSEYLISEVQKIAETDSRFG